MPWKLAARIVLIGSAFLFVACGDLPSISPTTALEAHISIPPEPKQPHYTKAKKEAPYNWQKCKDSNDTDCWKQEGERVHTVWKNFGQKMKTYWTNFGQRMRTYWSNLFHKNKKQNDTVLPAEDHDRVPVATTDATTTTTTTTKHHKKKDT